jgi:hypothetical protein
LKNTFNHKNHHSKTKDNIKKKFYIQVITSLLTKFIQSELMELIHSIEPDFEKACVIFDQIGEKIFDEGTLKETDYYKNALQYIVTEEINIHIKNKTNNVLYFCEDDDVETVEKAIDALRIDFPLLHFSRASSTQTDWEQMLLMSLCRHNIIANSSFSWWAAYFNSNVTKLVCYPEKWFGPATSNDTSDLFPEDWIQII